MKKYVEEIINTELQTDFTMLVLRGLDESAREGGDIDVLVPSGMSNIACRKLIDRVKVDDWYLIGFRELDYLSTVIIAKTSLNTNIAIKIDFFGGIEWYGVKNKVKEDFFFDTINSLMSTENGRSKAIATVTFLHKTMYAGRFNSRDINRIAPSFTDIKSILNMSDLLGDDFLYKGSVSLIKKWLIRFRISGFSVFSFPYWVLIIIFKAAKSKLRYGRSFSRYISFSGAGCSRKKNYLDELIALYVSSGESPPKSYKVKPSTLRYLNEYLDRKNPPLNRYLSIAILPLFLIDFLILKIRIDITTWRGVSVFVDHSFIDVVANTSKVELYKLLLPHGHHVLLSVDDEFINAKNCTSDSNDIKQESIKYLQIFNNIDGTIIDMKELEGDNFISIVEYIDSLYTSPLMSAK